MSTYSNSLILPLLLFTLIGLVTKAKAQQQDNRQDSGYVSPSAPVSTGKAPGMKVQLLSENAGVKNYAIVLAKDDEVMSGLSDFARQNKVTSATFTVIGAFSQVTVAWFDDSRRKFKLIPIKQQVELVSMIGDIALSGEQPAVHTHVSVASSDGTVRGGHLINAFVFPTQILEDYTSMESKIPAEFWAELKSHNLIEQNAPALSLSRN